MRVMSKITAIWYVTTVTCDTKFTSVSRKAADSVRVETAEYEDSRFSQSRHILPH